LQRDRDKQAKARAKIERRAQRAEEQPTDDAEAPVEVDQSTVLAQLAELHAAFDDGKIGLDEFEEQRDRLTSQLRID
jgi:hypothetical protein